MDIKQKDNIIQRRGELIAELFLEEFNPKQLSKPDFNAGYDYLVGFSNIGGGINLYPVLVKSTDKPLDPDQPSFPVSIEEFNRLAKSNFRAFILVIDVKRNKIYQSWISFDNQVDIAGDVIDFPVQEVDEGLRKRLQKEFPTRSHAPAWECIRTLK